LLGTETNTPFDKFNFYFSNNNFAMSKVDCNVKGDFIPEDAEKNAGKY
jgi:hypothetical protein